MISAGSSELTQKWVDVLHNDSDDYIIPESDVNVMCPYDCTSLSGYTVTANSVSQSTPSDMAISPIFMNRDKKIATFEWNFWVLDGSFEVLDTGETYSGFLSSGISDENCEYSTNPFVFFDTSAGFNMRKNQTLKFAPSCDDVPAQISIFGANSEETKTYYFNIEETLETQDILNQEYVHLFSDDIDTSFTATRIGMAFQKSLMPYRRARLTEYNNGYKFFLNKYDMQTFVHTRSCPLSMEELPQNDLEVSFVDMEKVFDSRYTDAPFHITFNNSQRFYVYYGYKFDDIGWHYVWVDSLVKNELEVDRESLNTTLRLQSTFNAYTQSYGSSKLKMTPASYTPYNWNDFNGFLMAISEMIAGAGITDMFSIGSQDIPDWETDWTKWQPSLKLAYNLDEGVSKVPLKEMAQQISAVLGLVMVRQPNETFYLKDWLSQDEDYVDDFENANIFSYPTKTKGERYREVYISTPKIYSEQADDEDVQVGESPNVVIYPRYKNVFSFANQSNVDGDIELSQTVAPLGIDEYCWSWSSNLWSRCASYFWTAKAGTTYEFSDLLLNPLLQVADLVYTYLGEGYNAYVGHIEKIEINYDGSFRGSIVINSAGYPEGD